MNAAFFRNKRVIFSLLWLLLTVSIGFWWLNLGLRQAELVAELKNAIGGKLAESSMEVLNRQNRMLKTEGVFFLAMLFTGGVFIIWFSYKDYERSRMIKEFFATVTHEMKTPLASLRLQVESLEEDLKDKTHKKILKRLINDSVRIESQMDKALYLASINRSETLYLNHYELKEILDNLKADWEIVNADIPEDLVIVADKRALESIFRNLFENSVAHGKATKVHVSAEALGDVAKIEISDNGTGFGGKISDLTIPFLRHSASSGSGIGLYLVRKLISKMNGKIEFVNPDSGFKVTLNLPLWRQG
ncbi:MAG: HAMP domain-containing histidine kinase [Leptospira sp.]|nr:HAMP domain-containing histidine kinase [Leptospira sp.]